MSTVEERYQKAVAGVESIVAVLTDLRDLGIYGKEELSAGVVLITTLERAMRVLDPEKAEEYAKSEVEKALATAKSGGSVDEIMSQMGAQTTGLYL